MYSVAQGRLPRHLEETYHGYAFNRWDSRGAFSYTSVEEWKHQTEYLNSWMDHLIPKLADDKLRAEETAHWEKGQVNWRLRGMGRLYYPEGLMVYGAEQAAWLEPFFKEKGKRYVAFLASQTLEDLSEAYFGGEVILNSGKGAPFWLPGSDPIGGVLTASALKDSRTIEDVIRWCESYGWPPLITIYDRVQASRKDEPWMEIIDGELIQTGTFRGPKVRPVKSVPFALNMYVVGYASLHRWLLKEISPRHRGDVTYANQMVSNHKYAWASDLSSYDETVTLETLAGYRTYVMAPILDHLVGRGLIARWQRDMILTIDEYIAVSNMLSPPIALDSAAIVVPTAGAIKSGERLTSNKGTDINDTRTEAKAKALNLKLEWVNFGDDLLLASDDPKAEKLWFSESFDNRGFVEGEADDTSFLMRRVPEGYSYFARMAFRSLNREYMEEPKGYLQCALGVKTRDALLKGEGIEGAVAHPLAEHFLPMLRGIDSPVALAADLASSTTLLELLEMVAAQQSLHGGGVGILSQQDYTQLTSILGEHVVQQLLLQYRGNMVQRSGMRYDEFLSIVDQTTVRDALRALHRRVSR